jgi:hypothetical protein
MKIKDEYAVNGWVREKSPHMLRIALNMILDTNKKVFSG